MAAPNKTIYVYADWLGMSTPMLFGTLAASHIRGKEVFSFEYNEEWLKSGETFVLDPSLQLYNGPQYNQDDKPNFGLFLDSSPDRWGRVLMKKREAILAKKEGRKATTLFESDFLLGVFDEHRMGGLRFKTNTDGEFLSTDKTYASPPWASLRDLEYASLQLENDEHYDDDEALKWLNLLLAPGSSLGGARPKASIKDQDGNLWIAKFPSAKDEHNVGAWELVAMEIASAVNLKVSSSILKKFTGKYDTFLSKRFDRNTKGDRIHFASAMTLLGYNDGADFQTGVSYLELAAFIAQNGSNVAEDLKELWKRIVLNICLKNTDDHLRNHGFLLTDSGWTLSPLYDINPFPTGTALTLNISEDDNSLDLDLAMEVIQYFRLKPAAASSIITDIRSSVSQWQTIAKKKGISTLEQTRKASDLLL